MAIRRFDEREAPRRWGGREDEAWPRSGEVGEHDRPWHQPEETWPSRRGMYGMGGASRAYNMGGYAPGEYERGYEMRSYDALADASEHWFGPDREGYADERELRPAWQVPSRRRERAPGVDRSGWDRWGGYHSVGSAAEWVARGRGPKGYQRSDERIREDVCDRLMESPMDASEVEVTVANGEVTLVGTVRYRHEKRAIEDVAHSVRGVHDVHNRIQVSDLQRARTLEGEPGGSLHS